MKVDNKIVMRSTVYCTLLGIIIFLYSLDINNYVSFQMLLLVGHLTNVIRHNNLLTDNILKKITQDVPVRCWLIVFVHDVKMAEHFQNSGYVQ